MQERFNLPLPWFSSTPCDRPPRATQEGPENRPARLLSALATRSCRRSRRRRKGSVSQSIISARTQTAGQGARQPERARHNAPSGMLEERARSGEVSNTRLVVRKVKGARGGRHAPFQSEYQVRIGVDDDGDAIDTLTIEWSEPKKTVDSVKTASQSEARRGRDSARSSISASQGSGQCSSPFSMRRTTSSSRPSGKEHVREEFYRTDLPRRSPEARKKLSAGRSSSPRAITSRRPGDRGGDVGVACALARTS